MECKARGALDHRKQAGQFQGLIDRSWQSSFPNLAKKTTNSAIVVVFRLGFSGLVGGGAGRSRVGHPLHERMAQEVLNRLQAERLDEFYRILRRDGDLESVDGRKDNVDNNGEREVHADDSERENN